LLFADITGYTAYLADTVLMHAQDVVADLLETIVAAIEPIFTLSKLEGDAAFAYADAHAIGPTMGSATVHRADRQPYTPAQTSEQEERADGRGLLHRTGGDRRVRRDRFQ
jgi:hypothetical protein